MKELICFYFFSIGLISAMALFYAGITNNTDCLIKSKWFYVAAPVHYACELGLYMNQPK